MDINVYLPDELGARAKEAGVKFSALLRDAVTDELARREAIERARDGMTEQNIDLDDYSGNPLRLRFTGKSVGGDSGVEVYLTDAGKVVVVLEEDYLTFEDVDLFSEWVAEPTRDNLGRSAEEALRVALAELGGRRVVDL